MAIIEQTANTQPAYGLFRKAGVPVDGTSGTLVGVALPGALLIDTTNGKLYQNTNTQASPTWTPVMRDMLYGPFTNAGTPANGSSGGTYAGTAQPGALLIDTTNRVLYQNTNSQISPTWTKCWRLTQQATIALLGTTSDLVGVDGNGSNAAPLAGTESRLDAIEAKLDAVIAALIAAGVLAAS